MESPTAEPAVTPTPPADEEMAPVDAPTTSDAPPPAVKADSPPPAPVAPVRAVPEVDIEAEAAKKRRQAILKAETEKRGKRMFGLMRGTLEQAKKETGKLSGATKNRKEVEERLHAKLNSERTELEEKRQRERETKELRLDVIKKEEEISTAESIYRTRNAAKLNLASFLCTSFTLPPPPPATDGITVPYDPRLPHVLRVTNPTAPKPLYYLPKRLLGFQEDLIEDQIASVKKHIRIERDAWEDRKGDKVSDLAAAKRKRDAGLEEIERAEREERQKRRREDDEFEERARAKPKLNNGPGAMEVDGGDSAAGANGAEDKANGIKREDGGGVDDDAAMDAGESGARPGGRGDGTPAEGGKMEVEGEGDELEY
ncbi:hypothetical protein RQP46_009395 [Phenoliferia psychrophenolica]